LFETATGCVKKQKTLYFDMDNVLVDFQPGIDQLSDETKKNTREG
jgi:FMN phosphatase YigB (HAD superfamily)